MSNMYQDWEDDDFDDDFDSDVEETRSPQRRASGDDVVKKLRKAERAQAKRIKELESELSGLRKMGRETKLRSVLETKGINPKIAALIPSDMDIDSKEFDTWIDEYADVLGVPAPSGATVNEVDLAALRQIDAVTSDAQSFGRAEDLLSRINNAGSEEELLNIIYGN
jgi:hypothetical protein